MKVSVCIPTYNQAIYLEQAIRSVINQTILPAEIIVSDDHSTDDTTNLLQNLTTHIPYLKTVRQRENLGITKNTDVCLRLAAHEYIVRLDSDDCLAPDYIEKLLALLSKHSGAGYAHGAIQEIDQYGNLLTVKKLARKTGFQASPDALRAAVNGYRVTANILMFRKSALQQVDFLTNRPNFAEDYHLTASISAAGFGNVYLDKVLSHYRVWIDTGMVRQRRKLDQITGLRAVFEDVLEPAFEKRQWNMNKLKRSRTRLACIQADCLSWPVYTQAEKDALETELYKLSSSPKARYFIWLYRNGFEKILIYSKHASASLIALVKPWLLKLKKFDVRF